VPVLLLEVAPREPELVADDPVAPEDPVEPVVVVARVPAVVELAEAVVDEAVIDDVRELVADVEAVAADDRELARPEEAELLRAVGRPDAPVVEVRDEEDELAPTVVAEADVVEADEVEAGEVEVDAKPERDPPELEVESALDAEEDALAVAAPDEPCAVLPVLSVAPEADESVADDAAVVLAEDEVASDEEPAFELLHPRLATKNTSAAAIRPTYPPIDRPRTGSRRRR
jgi:hypothetical protein